MLIMWQILRFTADLPMPKLVNFSEAVSLGLHTMALLAVEPKRRLINQQIAETLKASGHHLAKVMQRLARAGLVHSTPGPQGGFQLDKPAEEVRLLAIYEAIDGALEDEDCLWGEPICEGRKCMLGEMLHSLHSQLRDYLNNTTLAELAKGLPFDRLSRGAK